jgi:GNAT superfamily N-acetyltransferase
VTGKNLRIRAAVPRDAEWATSVYNAANPDEPHDLAFTEWWWAIEDDDWLDRRYAFELGDEPLGWAMVDHVVWDKNSKRVAGLDAWLHPRLHDKALLDEIYGWLESEAADLGALVLETNVSERALPVLELLIGRGYDRVGLQRYWELDLAGNRDRVSAMADKALTQAVAGGFRILALADDATENIEEELFENHEACRRDVPSASPYVPWSRSLFHEWLDDPRKHRDRFWIARSGDELAGMSLLAFPTSGAGPVSTAWTGVARTYRGQGLARALKLKTLVQAIELGVTRVRTDNDSGNAPILHLNEELGYRGVPGHVKLQLELSERRREMA